MPSTKPAVASVTVWGSLVTILMLGLQMAGKDVTGIDPNALSGQLADAAALASSAIAIWGRWRADSKISGIISSK